MEKIKEIMLSMGVIPKLRLGTKIKGSGVKSNGPHRVKFLNEPEGITAKNFEGKPTKYLRFKVESNEQEYHWLVAVLNKEGQASYMLERLADIKVGDERILEMTRQGARNYIDVRAVDEPAKLPDVDEGEDEDIEALGDK